MIGPKLHTYGSSRKHSRPRRRLVRMALVASLSLPAAAEAALPAQSNPSQYEVEAAYLFDFGKFVRYPAGGPARPASTFDICVVGDDPLDKALDSITANERLDGRRVRVRRMKEGAEARICDIAYISASEGGHLSRDLSDLRHADVLTVGDAPHFLELGGMIQFVTINDRVRFAINLKAVKKTHLQVSSELVRVAISLHGKGSLEARP